MREDERMREHGRKGADMVEKSFDPRDLLERLERVEAQNRNLKRGGMLLLVLLGAALWMGQDSVEPEPPVPQTVPPQPAAPRTVEAETFVVRDREGNTRAVLGLLPDGTTGLDLADGSGVFRASLSLGVDGTPSLELGDPSHKTRVSISVSA